MGIDNSVHERLVQLLQQSPSREWIEQYLDLVKEVIDLGKFENDDPRLVLSLTQRNNFPVTINRRYVLSGFRKGKPLVGFTVPYDFENLSKLIARSEPPEFSSHQWKPHPGEVAEKCPYFLAFEGFPANLLTPKQKSAWKQAVLAEIGRCSKSPYKHFHEPLIYKVVVDLTFRVAFLDEIFQKKENDNAIYRSIFKGLIYERDNRSPPDARRQAQFKIGWENAALSRRAYTDETLNSTLTWNNLGYHFGLQLGKCSDSEIQAAYNFLAQEYQINSSGSKILNLTNIYPDEVTSEEVFREGAVRQVSVNAYERDSKARQKCIDYYGTSCSVCSFNFGEFFGELGEGFIHVHHLRPISEIGEEYEVDPVKDLRPVCPNCHAMIHSHRPPLKIEELQALLHRAKVQPISGEDALAQVRGLIEP
ncbi:HNH endonuclease [Spirulina subsalsa]|uniref:HNH endonuclease n=1 Tax=Spirulina subsalsa TaxID=54311 RepID=UPI0002EEDE98|nr:HNH endonuclease [Spirulina subsalsa]